MFPDSDGVVPDWKLVLMAVSIIVYQHLDNIDGKQARKTSTFIHYLESSSPLGMLFDHGSDAVSAFLLAIQVMKILRLPFGMQLFCIYIFIMNTYFCAMWSQYSVGYFKLGKTFMNVGRVNPVDEGLPIYAIMCIMATAVDLKAFANTHHIFGTYS